MTWLTRRPHRPLAGTLCASVGVEGANFRGSGLPPVQQGGYGIPPNTFGHIHGLAPGSGGTRSGRMSYWLEAAPSTVGSSDSATVGLKRVRQRPGASTYDRTGV